ncbi:hypothetical protein K435DRAFT_803876 [Dendrothele bispora CBS 962.96]|uniref:Uncharacterized protein n=1 Tax=Dendrothele bispora (strain CBS 962.96) TaxID=1314807 RepID=A0A4S8LG45_DENBC|nr:hypothetical protein K435DRAFT_803876 [Dendrothele bispora CBS 962.96]
MVLTFAWRLGCAHFLSDGGGRGLGKEVGVTDSYGFATGGELEGQSLSRRAQSGEKVFNVGMPVCIGFSPLGVEEVEMVQVEVVEVDISGYLSSLGEGEPFFNFFPGDEETVGGEEGMGVKEEGLFLEEGEGIEWYCVWENAVFLATWSQVSYSSCPGRAQKAIVCRCVDAYLPFVSCLAPRYWLDVTKVPSPSSSVCYYHYYCSDIQSDTSPREFRDDTEAMHYISNKSKIVSKEFLVNKS